MEEKEEEKEEQEEEVKEEEKENEEEEKDDEEEEGISIPCKVVLIGNCKKYGIISRYISNPFNSLLFPSPGLIFTVKTIFLPEENKSIKFQIWDTAGQKKYCSFTKVFYKNASVIILVYDITNRNSFEDLKKYWINEIKNNISPDISKQIYI